jgi:hypothetical protein
LFGDKAFYWTAETGMIVLGDLGGDAGFQSVARAVSADGSVVVGEGGTKGVLSYGAFVWDSTNGIRLLRDLLQDDFGIDLSAWKLRAATDVSPNGLTIAGWGINPNGDTEAWIATLPEPDSDGDGVPDDVDDCPDSQLSATVVIDGCDTEVPNQLFDDGCTMADLTAQCADHAPNHGSFVRCVAHLTNDWKWDALITGKEKGRIQSCAAQADIP